jgi:hypothetical protein
MALEAVVAVTSSLASPGFDVTPLAGADVGPDFVPHPENGRIASRAAASRTGRPRGIEESPALGIQEQNANDKRQI